MGFVEAIFGRLFGWAVDAIESLIGKQRALRLRLDTRERVMMATLGPGGSMVMDYDGLIRIHNSGRDRLTVNRSGLVAKDGTTLVAFPPRPETLEPGGKELVASLGAGEIVSLAGDHGGLHKVFVEVAGEAKVRHYGIRDDWLPEVAAIAAKPLSKKF